MMKRTRPVNKENSGYFQFAFILLIVFGIILFYRHKYEVYEIFDKIILLERRSPNYANIESSSTQYNVLENIYSNGTNNQIVNQLSTRDYDEGFKIGINENGSITYSGINTTDHTIYITITPDSWKLNEGDYILSDGLEEEKVSTEDIGIYVEGRTFEIGGNTNYTTLSSLINEESHEFTADGSLYNQYAVILYITSGYQSDGITFYPMITDNSKKSDHYQPCYAPFADDNSEEPRITFTMYETSKYDFFSMTENEMQVLQRSIKHIDSGAWSTVSFGDGTGVLLDRNEINKSEYGEINSIGQITNPIGAIDEIEVGNTPLNKETYFENYLRDLNNNDYIIFLAIRDEGISALNEKHLELLQDLGLKTEFNSDYYRNSYYAVIDNDKVIEEIGENTLHCSSSTSDISYEITSSGMLTGEPNASIVINGTEYCMNRRGMNFVVYSKRKKSVIDTVAFDTFSGLYCYRPIDYY